MTSKNGRQGKRAAKKPPAAKSASNGNGKPIPPLVAQPHGGALFTGGVPGNRGGSNGGRPPSAIREQLRGSFAERIPILEQFADGAVPITEKCPKCGYSPANADAIETVDHTDRLRALEMLAKHGLDDPPLKQVIVLASPELRERLERQAQLFTERLTGDALAIVRSITDEVWQ